MSRRFYVLLPVVEYYKDPFQNLAHRVTAGVGVGYDIVDRPKLEWNPSTGPAYSFVWDRIEHPKVRADGTQPKPDDFRLFVGLGADS